jgi:hypothetical protein
MERGELPMEPERHLDRRERVVATAAPPPNVKAKTGKPAKVEDMGMDDFFEDDDGESSESTAKPDDDNSDDIDG